MATSQDGVALRAAIAGLLALVLAACDEPFAIRPQNQHTQALGTVGPAAFDQVVAEPSAIRLFDLTITIDPKAALGVPFAVTASARALQDGNIVRLSIFAPDVASGDGPPIGRRARSRASSNKDITRNLMASQYAEVTESFVVSSPGLYRFSAVARLPQAHRINSKRTEDALRTQNVVVREAWVMFDSSGATSFPSESVVEAIARGRHESVARGLAAIRDSQIAQSQVEAPQNCTGYAGVAYYINFDVENAVTTPPIARAIVAGFYVPLSGSAANVPYTTLTDDEGDFYIPSMTNMSFSGHLQLENSRLRVGLDGYGIPHQTAITLSQTCSGSGIHLVSSSTKGKVWDIAELSSRRAIANFGRLRPPLVFNLVSGDSAFYFSGVDRVEMGVDIVWEEYGTFTIGHEYGHAYQHHALGGGAFGGCLGAHFASGAYTLKCAYSEGFADFFAAITLDDRLIESDGWETAIENAPLGPFLPSIGLSPGYWCLNKTVAGACPIAQHTTNGGIAEFAVAGLFYDLLDSPSTQNVNSGTDDDGFNYTWSWLGDVLNSCQVQEGGSWRRADGIDHVIYCMERSLGTYFADGYFPTRAVGPGGWSAAATQPPGWSQRAFRSLWKGTMFVHGPPAQQPPPPQSFSATIHGFATVAPSTTCTWYVSSNVPGGVSYTWTVNGQSVGTDSSTLQLVTPSGNFQLAVVVTNSQLQGASTALQVTVNAGTGPCLDL